MKGLGYRIVKRNYRTPFGEADIVALDGETVVFCEVKARLSERYGTPGSAVESRKQRRYIDVARYFFLLAGAEFSVRFDVIEVFADRVNHIVAAFEA